MHLWWDLQAQKHISILLLNALVFYSFDAKFFLELEDYEKYLYPNEGKIILK